MNEHTVEAGMRRLESISARFNYDLGLDYVGLAKQFLRRMEAVHASWPLSNICEGVEIDLPDDVSLRFQAFLKAKAEYGYTAQKVCYWFLIELLAMERGLRPQQDSIYEPLIEILERGGDFDQHHGWLCIRDIASIPLVGHAPPQ